jgi:predicted HicB family RNase H-like nuclease
VRGPSAQNPPDSRAGEARPVNLARQPQRPGELCEELRIDMGRVAAAALENCAAAAGLPNPLWTTLAIEARRCLALAAMEFGIDARLLDDAASERRGGWGRLADYANALRAATPRAATPVHGTIVARPSVLMDSAWRRCAAAAEISLEQWAIRQLRAPAPAGLVEWEAAAAEGGHSLSEWTLVQAARASRSESTSAHSLA